jgi:hypothetical protein
MLSVWMCKMLGGRTAGVWACAAREPASARDNPAMEQSHFFMSAHLQGARRYPYILRGVYVSVQYCSGLWSKVLIQFIRRGKCSKRNGDLRRCDSIKSSGRGWPNRSAESKGPTRPKRLRFLIFNTPGRVAYHARRMVLRLVTRLERLGEWLEAWRLLPLRT